MKFNDFVNSVKIRGGIDTDGVYGKQCMDLYNYYCKQVLELSKNTGAVCAKKILNNSYVMQNMERIDNTLTFVPKKGDIAVFTGGTYGHVSICLGDGDVNHFKSLDQNWQSQKLTEENHNYTYLAPLVFLRPKNQKNIVEDTSFTVRVEKEKAAVRSNPTSKSAQAGSKILYRDETFKATEIVIGENVAGNNKWYHSKVGNYVWSGGCIRI